MGEQFAHNLTYYDLVSMDIPIWFLNFLMQNLVEKPSYFLTLYETEFCNCNFVMHTILITPIAIFQAFRNTKSLYVNFLER